jgi:hypothetical protein
MATPALLGVDVGFAKSKKTTGLAWFANSTIETALTGSSWSERSRSLPRGVRFAIAALDAPIVPADNCDAPRGCEHTFYGGAFWNRCRPGLSHHGRRGLALRDAGRQAAQQFAAVLEPVAAIRLLQYCAVRFDSRVATARISDIHNPMRRGRT